MTALFKRTRSVRKAFIVRRHVPSWAEVGESYRATGVYDPSDFLPEPLPPGFSESLPACIDVWNKAMGIDFFSCRARLAEISDQSIRSVRGGEVKDVSALGEVIETLRKDRQSLCFFVDDDDWYAPHLVEVLAGSVLRADAVRWPDLLLINGALYYRPVQRLFPRLGFRLRDLRKQNPARFGWLPQPLRWGATRSELPVWEISHLVQTNNYGITSRFMKRESDIGEVVDHVHASDYFRTGWRLGLQTIPRQVLSVTNKHPCSATQLLEAVRGPAPEDALRAYVERFVERGRRQSIPKEILWVRSLIDQTLNLFDAALRQ